eukprot:TRINITY_DN8763_c0_g1_i1.p1 TRINITY_DN8763_c0_g1~~TRINITY_DN8763_c0_g1_i1.p1  ORF type:complete len:559 (-),score=142.71 TRINITY_DN8763_c0_g1_i1:382-2058(-)
MDVDTPEGGGGGATLHAEQKERLHFGEIQVPNASAQAKAAAAAVALGGVVQEGEPERIEFSEHTQALKDTHNKMLEHFEERKKLKQVVVPTNDLEVKMRLRELGAPICLFGEIASDRRNRLRKVIADQGITEIAPSQAAAMEEKRIAEENSLLEDYHTIGDPRVQAIRYQIARDSLSKAKARLLNERRMRAEETELREEYINSGVDTSQQGLGSALLQIAGGAPSAANIKKRKRTSEEEEGRAYRDHVEGLAIETSQVGDDRALTCCAFSPDDTMVATSSWSGVCCIWNSRTAEKLVTLRGHEDRAQAVAFHPLCGSESTSHTGSTVNVASCSADMTVKLWSLRSPTPLATLTGHTHRVNRVAFHPLNYLMVSTSHDRTWKMWDLNTAQEVMTQDGHSREVYSVAVHPDGSLIATGGFDAIIRLWDMRSGNSVCFVKGHVKQVLSMDFAPNGHVLASGGDDHTIRIFDLRKRKNVYTIPAHSKLVSQVKYEPKHGSYLVSSSFDRTIKIWSTEDHTLIKSLAGHEQQVSGVDISRNSETLVSCGLLDKTWKLWKAPEF